MVSLLGLAEVILLQALFALTYPIGKMALSYSPPITFVSFQMLLTGIAMLLVYYVTEKKRKAIKQEDMFAFIQFGLLGMYVNYVAYYVSLKNLSPAKESLIFVLAPFVTALFAYFKGIETFTRKKIIGLFVGFLGFLPILHFKVAHSKVSVMTMDIAEVLAFISLACYAYGWLPVQYLTKEKKYSPWIVNGLGITSAGVLSGFTAFFYDGWYNGAQPIHQWGEFFWYTLITAVIVMAVYFLYAYVLKFFSVTLVSFFGFLQAFFAALYSWFLMGETVSWMFFVSLFIVSVGLYIFSESELT